MAIDGIMLSAIKYDFNQNIVGGRIDKIYQPENKLLTFDLRQPGKNIRFLVSINPQRSRVHLTNLNFDNPSHPPAFCMLLRKYLIRGIITEITQPDFERILKFTISNENTVYTLILEIMGRYSNVILVDENKTVLDAMKRITKDISSERQLYPGIKYHYPPAQDKLNPLKVTRNDFFTQIPSDFGKYCDKAIMYNFRGIGPDMAKEIIYRADIDYQQPFCELSSDKKESIWESFHELFYKIEHNQYQPTIGSDEKEEISYQAAFPLTYRKSDKQLSFPDTGKLFDYYYEHHIQNYKFRRFQQRLQDIVNNYWKKNDKKQHQLKQQLAATKNADKYKKMGELITANIHNIRRGQKQVTVINYYDPDQKQIKITLDPELKPAENAQKYFKKYNKTKKSIKHLKKELGKFRHEERYLNQVKLNIDQSENQEELLEIEEELIEEGYIKKQKQNKSRQDKPLPPHKFKSSQGYDIQVGRNNHQNDYLTKKIANDQDLWLHTKKIAGSHVIIRNHTGKQIPEKTIKEAAVLAAYYSKAKMSANVPIDFTEVKYVNKPKGAKPGLVYYDDYQTIYVDPDRELVNKLKIN